MIPGNDGEYCVGSDGNSDRHGVSFDLLVDGDHATGGISCNIPAEVGETAFEIIAPKDATGLKITYGRPLYAPGWKILRDGVQILNEASNRGTAELPGPVTYDDYVFADVATYTFVISAKAASTIGLHIAEIEFVDADGNDV